MDFSWRERSAASRLRTVRSSPTCCNTTTELSTLFDMIYPSCTPTQLNWPTLKWPFWANLSDHYAIYVSSRPVGTRNNSRMARYSLLTWKLNFIGVSFVDWTTIPVCETPGYSCQQRRCAKIYPSSNSMRVSASASYWNGSHLRRKYSEQNNRECILDAIAISLIWCLVVCTSFYWLNFTWTPWPTSRAVGKFTVPLKRYLRGWMSPTIKPWNGLRDKLT